MEHWQVVIVGAGPAGLVLGLALGKHGIRTLILEKEEHIVTDPRGIYLAGDALRYLWSLGLEKYMHTIGQAQAVVNFHVSSFNSPPFYALDMTTDVQQHVVPGGIMQIQPALEKALRDEIKTCESCTLRVSCEVLSIEHRPSGAQVKFMESHSREVVSIFCSWVIGADGKRGVVRKGFLEKVANIRQIETTYRYEGTWVAANLHIDLCTPETHPDFPAWQIGMTPLEVYDLFWPRDFHFCSPPGKAVAASRFGPDVARLWRHEFAQPDWDSATMNEEDLLWENLIPQITRSHDARGVRLPGGPVCYPRDCIQVLRCRSFAFTHKVLNQWFDKRCILIGDAAHVFPPFGGQGIASGIRDAYQLAWRLAHLESKGSQVSAAYVQSVLNVWAAERDKSVADAAELTRMNGMLCNEHPGIVVRTKAWLQTVLPWRFRSDPIVPIIPEFAGDLERLGIKGVVGGFFLEDRGGGGKLPQIYVESADELEQRPLLSDALFSFSTHTPLRLFIFGSSSIRVEDIASWLSEAGIATSVLSMESLVQFSMTTQTFLGGRIQGLRLILPVPADKVPGTLRAGYDPSAFQVALGSDTMFAIVRADCYVFATAQSVNDLKTCLQKLGQMC